MNLISGDGDTDDDEDMTWLVRWVNKNTKKHDEMARRFFSLFFITRKDVIDDSV